MYRKYRKLVSAGLVLTMAGAMTLQGCGQKEKTGKTEIELVQYKPEAVKTFEKNLTVHMMIFILQLNLRMMQ